MPLIRGPLARQISKLAHPRRGTGLYVGRRRPQAAPLP